jgi:glycolate oxidase subunit GlcD
VTFEDDLRGQVRGSLVADPAVVEAYRHDQCLLAEAGTPRVVVKAACTADVVAVVSLAAEHGVPVVVRGAGTGLAGAANAIDGCVVLVMDGMNRVLELDPSRRIAVVEPGVVNGDLDRRAREHGLVYVPDPGSRDISTIGGNIATNAGGMCCAKYGVTRDHVLGVTAVIGTGEVVRLGRETIKDVAGLDLVRVLVGSEGTLGVVVEAVVRLRRRPAGLATLAATFASPGAAAESVLAFEAVADAAAVELLDTTTIRAINAMTSMGLDEGGTLVLAQFDGPTGGDEAAACALLAESGGAEVFVTGDPDEGEALMAARRLAYPALERLGSTLLDDVAVRPERLPELLADIDDIAARHGVTIGTFGHARDGNMHPTVIFDAMDPRATEAARGAFDEMVTAALDLGGTITGEHGVGVLKAPFISRQLGQTELDLMRRVKRAFDPAGILNPGRAY